MKLTWLPPNRPHQPFVLQEGDRQRATLSFHDETGRQAVAEIEGRKLLFQRTHHEVTVSRPDSAEPVARFAASVVAFATGRSYRWCRQSLLDNHSFCFRCLQGKSSVCVTQHAGPLLSGGQVTVCADAAHLDETPVLVLLAWYLRVQAFEELVDTIACA